MADVIVDLAMADLAMEVAQADTAAVEEVEGTEANAHMVAAVEEATAAVEEVDMVEDGTIAMVGDAHPAEEEGTVADATMILGRPVVTSTRRLCVLRVCFWWLPCYVRPCCWAL